METSQRKKKYLGVGLLLLFFPISAFLVLSNGLSPGPELPATSQATEVLSKVNMIKAQELKEWLDHGRSFLLLDARSPEEFAGGHIPTAVSMHYHQSSETSTRDSGRQVPVVFYCSGHSGTTYDRCFQIIVRKLQRGSDQVYWFKEGMRAWRAQGYPVMRSSQKGEANK